MKKKTIAILLSALMAVNVIAVTYAATDEEIEKRINEVMEEDLKYYRDGQTFIEDSMSMAPASKSAANGIYEAEAMEDGAVYEEAAADGAYDEGGAVESYAESDRDGATLGMPYQGGGIYVEDDIYGTEDPNSFNTEEYSPITEHGFVSAKAEAFSTFGADVDTASYSTMRRKLVEPYALGYTAAPLEKSAIRVEEMVNYFKYNYQEPENGDKFGVTTVLTKCPWNEDALLLKVGIKAEEYKNAAPGSNIVFLVDTSGSMFDFDKLPLVKNSIEILQNNFGDRDRISIVTYAGSEEVLAEGLSGGDHEKIMEAIDSMQAWGSTWGEGGIQKAYEIAEKYYIEGGNNRVILCTDGDFNVGVSSEAGLKELISGKRETGIFFSCLGFGEGNYSDTTMETLADNGNGNYFYIDSPREAERALNEEFFSTIYTVAKDAKFQIEFNPATVKGYRQIGYENRAMSAEDFADDKKDGGEVGAGQTVTVLYEVIPADSDFEIPEVSSKYQTEPASTSDELLTVNIRWKEPDADTSELREYPVSMENYTEEMDPDTSWAAGVAQAGMLLRGSSYAGTSSYEGIYDRLKENEDIMEDDFKAEFMFLLRLMKEL